MKLFRIAAACILFFSLLLSSNVPEEFVDDGKASAAGSYVDSLRFALELPALSVAVAAQGRLIWSYTSGWADSSGGVSASRHTRFRIGSVSKLFTAVAALRLYDAGILNIDLPIGEYVSSAPVSATPITPRLLAGHLAGIRHYGRTDYINTEYYPDLRASLNRFIEDSLIAEPGSKYNYSSYGYNLLGAVLESAAGKDFRDIIREEIVQQMDLTSTVPGDSGKSAGEAAYYMRVAGGDLREAPRVDLSDRWPSGGYLATASDLARFGSGVFAPDYLSDAARELMLTSMQTADGETTGVGFGWRNGTEDRGRRITHHGGEAMGSRAFLLVYPDDGLAVALLTNLSFAPLGVLEATRIAELLYIAHINR